MMASEEEAKEKMCPVLSTMGDYGNLHKMRCHGSGCMAWKKAIIDMVNVDEHTTAPVWGGYCGMTHP